MEGQLIIFILIFLAAFPCGQSMKHHKKWGKCFEGEIYPVDQQKHWMGNSCYDVEGNEYQSNQTILSCCGCIKLACFTGPVPLESFSESHWNVSVEDTCCKDCHGKVYPIGAVMGSHSLADKCTTTVTKQCLSQSQGDDITAVISERYDWSSCCVDSTGLHPLGSTILEPASCSSRNCSLPHGNLYSSWISSMKECPGAGCGCCVHDGQLVCDGGHVTLVDGVIATCCEGELLKVPPTGPAEPGTTEPGTTESGTTEPGTTTTTVSWGSWSPWGPWSACSATCGVASKERKRNCVDPPCPPGGEEEETVQCDSLPSCGVFGVEQKCFWENSTFSFLDLGHNHLEQDLKPVWTISDNGDTLYEEVNTRPSVGLSNLGDPSKPVSFSGRVFSTVNDDDVIGMVFGFFNETNFFVVASSAQIPGPTNWYVGRLHATCGSSCASTTTISDAIWDPPSHPKDITVLAMGSNDWHYTIKYRFNVCFNPAQLELSVKVNIDGSVNAILESGVISAKTNITAVDDISRQGGYVGVFVNSQAKTTWDELNCDLCTLI